MPTIELKGKKPFSRTDAGGPPAPAPDQAEAAELSAYLEAFRAMQSMMDNWRSQLGIPSLSAAARPGAPVADGAQVVGVIDSLQSPGQAAPTGEAPLSAGALKRRLALQLGKAQGSHPGKSLGRPEEDIIDMVGMMFDYILDDKNIPGPIKCLIVRLQIPIIKVAILDKTFFAKRNHACRLLLNDLAQAGAGLAEAELGADNPIMQKVAAVVATILKEFSQDVGLFDALLRDFSAFMEKESKRSALAENRTLQTSQSKEKVWLSKKAVACEISARLRNQDAPVGFRTFIYNDWKDVMFLAYLRRDKNPAEWTWSLDTLDKLVWSITPPANAQERANLLREMPALVKDIRRGLESTSLDARQIESTLKDLAICHMGTLHSNASLKRAAAPAQAKTAEAILPTEDVNIKDAELAEAILEIKSHLPDIANVDVEEVIMGGDGALPGGGAASWLMDFVKDRHWEAANDLKVGDWIGYSDENGKLLRAKLAWKSPATSLCIFVNRRGLKVLELKFKDLVARLRSGRAHVLESTDIPLTDRAMSFLTQSLQNPFAKPLQAPDFA